MQMWGRTSAKVVIPDCLFFISWICTGTQNLQHHVRRCVCVYIYTHMCKRLYLQSQCVVHPCESRFVGHLLKERLFGRGYSRSALASVSRADFDCTTFHRGLLNLRWRICFAGPECPEHGSWACTRTFRHRCVCEHGSTGGQSPCFPLTCPCWISNELQKNNFSMFFFCQQSLGPVQCFKLTQAVPFQRSRNLYKKPKAGLSGSWLRWGLPVWIVAGRQRYRTLLHLAPYSSLQAIVDCQCSITRPETKQKHLLEYTPWQHGPSLVRTDTHNAT